MLVKSDLFSCSSKSFFSEQSIESCCSSCLGVLWCVCVCVCVFLCVSVCDFVLCPVCRRVSVKVRRNNNKLVDSNVRDSKFHTRGVHQRDVTKNRSEKLEKLVSMSAIFFVFFVLLLFPFHRLFVCPFALESPSFTQGTLPFHPRTHHPRTTRNTHRVGNPSHTSLTDTSFTALSFPFFGHVCQMIAINYGFETRKIGSTSVFFYKFFELNALMRFRHVSSLS